MEKSEGEGLAFLKPNNSLFLLIAVLLVLGYMLPSMAWFFVVMFGLGYVLVREVNFMTFGYGLAAFAVLSILFNLIGIPLHWYVFLAISLAIIAYFYYKKELVFDFSNFSVKQNISILLVILMVLINIYVYWHGASIYPYLEDDDPWHHAEGVKWIAETGSYSRTIQNVLDYKLYIEPYPPAYDTLLANLYQLGESVVDTLKFYNAFLIGFGLFFAFYAFSEITKNKKIALLGTFFLFILPCFMSHFIWAQSLALILMFVAFHGYEKSIGDKKWFLPAGVVIAAIAVTQPSTALNLALFSVLYFVGKVFIQGKSVAKPLLIVAVIGLVLSLFYYVPTFMKFGFEEAMIGMGFTPDLVEAGSSGDTSGGLVYTINDFIDAPLATKIDQAIGIGPVLSLLLLIGVVFMLKDFHKGERKAWVVIALLWLILTILGTQGNALPTKLFPHRFWAFLAIPVALCASYGYTALERYAGNSKKVLLFFVLLLVIYTSGIPKLTVQTSYWPPGVSFASQQELTGYVTMENSFPTNTKVFALCSPDRKVIGFDMDAESYVEEYAAFKRSIEEKSADETHLFLLSRGYQYLTFDSSCVNKFGPEKTQELVNDYMNSGKYEVIFSNEGFMLMELK